MSQLPTTGPAAPPPAESDLYPLHTASRNGPIQAVESLLSTNAKLAKQADEDGRLPIHWACAHNHLDIIRLLASQRNFDDIIDSQDSSGWTPLMISSALKSDEGFPALDLLLSKGADVKSVSNSGATALHFATSKLNIDVVRKLLAAGASARTKDKRGQYPLHRAAAVGNVPLVRELIKAKSPLNATDVDGMTALHHAVCEGHGDVAVELMKAGAETDRKDMDGRLAIDCAPDGQIRQYILRAAENEGIDVEGAE